MIIKINNIMYRRKRKNSSRSKHTIFLKLTLLSIPHVMVSEWCAWRGKMFWRSRRATHHGSSSLQTTWTAPQLYILLNTTDPGSNSLHGLQSCIHPGSDQCFSSKAYGIKGGVQAWWAALASYQQLCSTTCTLSSVMGGAFIYLAAQHYGMMGLTGLGPSIGPKHSWYIFTLW